MRASKNIDAGVLDRQAFEDYRKHLGKVIHVKFVTGYVGDTDEQIDVSGDMLVHVRKTEECDIRHWCDDWLDPMWDVKVIQGPPAAFTIRYPWTYGISYCVDGSIDTGGVRLETMGEKFRRLTRLFKAA